MCISKYRQNIHHILEHLLDSMQFLGSLVYWCTGYRYSKGKQIQF